MERFFGTLKRECPMDFETHQQARSDIFKYIESFYTIGCAGTRLWTISVQSILSCLNARFPFQGLYKNGSTTFLVI
jgi:Integrase core domain